MKNKNIVIGLIVLISLFFVLLVILMFIDINNSPNMIKYMFSKGNSDDLAITKTYKEDFDVIKINGTGCDINIKHIDSDEFIVNVYGDKKGAVVKASDNQLFIDINKDNFINEDLYKVVIYLPFTYDRYVFIDNEYGNINISNFKNTNFEIDLGYGNIYVDEANRLEINNELGDIYIGNSTYVDINSSISRIDIDEVNEVVIDNNIGNIIIRKVTSYIDLENDFGDIKITNINLDRDSKLNLDIGDIDIKYITGSKMSADSIIGIVKDERKNNKGNNKFIVKNKVGNINIK